MAQARGAIDLAIIGVMADGSLRRSEAAALTWSDIEIWPDGSARITIRKSKLDFVHSSRVGGRICEAVV